VAYRSLAKHYRKFYNNALLGRALLTSKKQAWVDLFTLGLTLIGTLIGAGGDLLLRGGW
jgi:hypothetical protein